MFKVFSDDAQCKHIIFGVGLTLTYVDMLPYEESGKVILLRTGPIDPIYEELGMKIVEFNEIFRYTACDEPREGGRAIRTNSLNSMAHARKTGRCWNFQNVCRSLSVPFLIFKLTLLLRVVALDATANSTISPSSTPSSNPPTQTDSRLQQAIRTIYLCMDPPASSP